MVGIISEGLATSTSADAMGLDAFPSTTGEVAGAGVVGGFAGAPGPRLARFVARGGGAGTGMDAGSIGLSAALDEQQQEPVPLLDPAAATERFGIPGVLKFDKPISEAAAQDLSESKHAQQVRQDAINRRAGGLATGQAAQLVYGFVGGMLDPLSLGAALVPGVGEARIAGALGIGMAERAGGQVAAATLGGRLATRALSGASAGAAGTAALEPLNYALDRAEGEDWHMADALRNIAFGSVLGGGLHVAGGAVGDRMAARRAARGPGGAEPNNPLPPGEGVGEGAGSSNPVTARLDAAGPEARETLLQGALAQHVDGQPVAVGAGLDAMEAVKAAGLARSDPRLSEWTQTRDGLQARLAEREADLARFQDAREARNRGEAPELLAGYQTPAAVDASIRQREAGTAALRGRLAAIEHGVGAIKGGGEPGFQLRYDDAEMNRPAGLDAPGQMPQTLLSRLRQLGGLQDSGGELAARDLHKTPGMVRAGGMRLEDATVRMAEEGYLPGLRQDMAGSGVEQVDRIGALLDAMDEQRSGRPVLREDDVPAWDALMARHEDAATRLRMAAEHLGITEAEARGLSRGQLGDVLQRRDAVEARTADLDGLDAMPGWDDPVPVRSADELSADAAAATDRMRSDAAASDPAAAGDDRAMQATAERAPQVATTRGDAALAEATKAADAALARVETEVAAGRLPADALAGLDEAAKLAEGDAKAHEAAATCMVARGFR